LKNPRKNETCTCVKNVEVEFSNQKIVKDMERGKYQHQIKIPKNETEVKLKVQYEEEYGMPDKEIVYEIDLNKDGFKCFDLTKMIEFK
jgi:hypothetical protein